MCRSVAVAGAAGAMLVCSIATSLMPGPIPTAALASAPLTMKGCKLVPEKLMVAAIAATGIEQHG